MTHPVCAVKFHRPGTELRRVYYALCKLYECSSVYDKEKNRANCFSFMKKFLTIIFLIVSMAYAYAENHTIYSVVIIYPTSGEVIMVDEYSKVHGNSGFFESKENCLRDSDGKEIKFNNVLPLIGYLQTQGYTIPDLLNQLESNARTIGKSASYLVVTKEVSEEEWHEWIENGKRK